MGLKAYVISETPFRKGMQNYEHETRNKNEHWFESSREEAAQAQSSSFITFMAGVSQDPLSEPSEPPAL